MGKNRNIPPVGSPSKKPVTTQKNGALLRQVEELMHSEELFRNSFEHASIGMALGVYDGTFARTNAAFDSMMGYEPGELIGVHRSVLTLPEDVDENEERYRQFLETGVPSLSYEKRYVRKDGRIIWVDMNVSFIRDGDGNARLSIIMARDITDRKRTDAALRKSESLYRLLAENVSDVIWTMDMNLNFTYISPSVARFRGITAEEAIHQPLREVLTPRSYEIVLRVLQEELTEEDIGPKNLAGSRVLELEHIRKDGSTGWAEVKVSFLRDPSGQPNGILGVTRDIAHRKEAERELKMKSRSLEEVNTALKVLLDQRERDKSDLEDKILFNVKKLVLPYLDSLKQRQLDDEQKTYLDVLETNLKNIISPFAKKLTSMYENFTPQEIKVADFMRDGKTVKEIARTLGVSESAINIHRQHIRNKLGLKHQKTNLRTYLLSLTSN